MSVLILNTKLWLAVLLIRCEPQSGLFSCPSLYGFPSHYARAFYEFILFSWTVLKNLIITEEITCFFPIALLKHILYNEKSRHNDIRYHKEQDVII